MLIPLPLQRRTFSAYKRFIVQLSPGPCSGHVLQDTEMVEFKMQRLTWSVTKMDRIRNNITRVTPRVDKFRLLKIMNYVTAAEAKGLG